MEWILYKRLKNILAKPVHVPKLYHSNHTGPFIFIAVVGHFHSRPGRRERKDAVEQKDRDIQCQSWIEHCSLSQINWEGESFKYLLIGK